MFSGSDRQGSSNGQDGRSGSGRILKKGSNGNSDAQNSPDNNNGNGLLPETTSSVSGGGVTDDTPTALLEQLVYVDNFLQRNDDPMTDSPNFEEQLSTELAAFADDEFIFPDEEKPKKPKVGSSDDNKSSRNEHSASPALGNGNSWQFIDNNSQRGTRHAASPNGSGLDHQHGPTSEASAANNYGFSVTSPFGGSFTGFNGTQSLTNNSTEFQNQQPTVSGSQANPIAPGASVEQVERAMPHVEIPSGARQTLAAAGLSQTQIEALASLVAYHKGDLLEKAETVTNTKNSNNNSMEMVSSLLDPRSNHTSPANQVSSTDYTNTTPATVLPPGIAANFAATADTFPLNMGNKAASDFGQQTSSLRHDARSSSGSRPGSRVHSPLSTFSTTSSNLSAQSRSSPVESGWRSKPRNTRRTPLSDSKIDTDHDKRRRNTAASARFRIKKRMQEQQMEQNLRELTQNSKALEQKVQQLEMENRLLRNLVIEKNHQRDAEEVEQLKKRAKLSVEAEGKTPGAKTGHQKGAETSKGEPSGLLSINGN